MARVITKFLTRGKQKGQSQRRCDGGTGQRDAGPRGRECGPLEAGKDEDKDFPLDPSKECCPAYLFKSSDLQNYEISNLCFKPLSL